MKYMHQISAMTALEEVAQEHLGHLLQEQKIGGIASDFLQQGLS